MKKITSSNTKAEILSVYNELLDVLKSERNNNTALRRELEKKQQLVASVAKEAKGGVTDSLADMRRIINEQLDKVEKGISEEQNKFESLQEAIKVEKDNLENLYKIKTEAESLEALILTKKKANEKLESSYDLRKETLEDEIKTKKQAWIREEEAYQYQLKIERRNEEDSYKRKKEEQATELEAIKSVVKERETAIGEKEAEFLSLQKQVEGFDEQLQSAVAKAEKSLTDQLTKEFDYKQKLDNKDLQAKISLQQLEIESLNKKIDDKQELIKSLSVQSDNASVQVKEIALKAIESTGIKNLNFPSVGNREE